MQRWCALGKAAQKRLTPAQKAQSKRLQSEYVKSVRDKNEAAGLRRDGTAESSSSLASLVRLEAGARRPVADAAAALTALRELLSLGATGGVRSNGWGNMAARLLAGGCTDSYEAACEALVRAR